GRRLLTDLGITHPDAVQRLNELLAELAAGFTEALHRQDLAAGESINRAERVAWRDHQRRLTAQVQHALLHDQVTGLPNRASLTRWLHGALTDPASGQRLGLCVLHLDGFDDISDALGPEQADRLLATAARHLRAAAAQGPYYLAHLGRGEYALIVEHTTTVEDAVKAAEHAQRALPSRYRLAGHDITVTARAGIVEQPCAQASPDELVRTARQALRWAKTDNRPWMLYTEHRDALDRTQYTLSAAMPAALRNNQFHLAYQPMRRLPYGRVAGVAALARWLHPTHGAVPPARFVPLANRTGLINPLGAHLLHLACTQAHHWYRTGSTGVHVSVNLSTTQLHHAGLPATVATILDHTGLPPHLLVLEVAEDALHSGTALNTLHDVRRLGAGVAIEDFGTGYSNLAGLRTAPATALKIDTGFLAGTPHAHTMLATVIRLAHHLDLTVIATGVDSPDQAQRLADLGCDIGQGQALGHPTTPTGIIHLLNTA
ncbi:MAG TPA: EAL domain-containing protein, partial [Rugosimonospora sp.]|nr:EAL domain-containing protein [Rugosimonospora sp.]